LLVTTTAEGVVRIYRVATGQLVHHWQVPASLSNVSISHNERLLALGSNLNENGVHIEIWDPIVGVPLTTCDLPGHTLRALAGLAFDPDADSVLAHTKTNELFILKLPPTGQSLIDQARARVASPDAELLTHEQRVRFSLASP
jgi:hypothetical protein